MIIHEMLNSYYVSNMHKADDINGISVQAAYLFEISAARLSSSVCCLVFQVLVLSGVHKDSGVPAVAPVSHCGDAIRGQLVL